MGDGRIELEKAIEVWEKRHTAAVQAKREAEVVMPFLRAAVEELDSFREGNKTPVAVPFEAASHETASAGMEPAAPAAHEESAAPMADDAADKLADTTALAALANVARPRGIAALMDDEETLGDTATG